MSCPVFLFCFVINQQAADIPQALGAEAITIVLNILYIFHLLLSRSVPLFIGDTKFTRNHLPLRYILYTTFLADRSLS